MVKRVKLKLSSGGLHGISDAEWAEYARTNDEIELEAYDLSDTESVDHNVLLSPSEMDEAGYAELTLPEIEKAYKEAAFPKSSTKKGDYTVYSEDRSLSVNTGMSTLLQAMEKPRFIEGVDPESARPKPLTQPVQSWVQDPNYQNQFGYY